MFHCPFPVLLSLLVVLAPTDWPQLHGAASDRSSGETIALKQWPDSGLEATWRIPTELGFSSFVIADGRAFTLVQRDGEETLLAVAAEDGEELWAATLEKIKYDGGGDSGASDNRGGDGPRSTPTIDGNLVYAYDANLQLYCYNCKTGKRVWTRNIQKEYAGRNTRWQNAASPLVDGDLVIVAGGGVGQSLLAFQKMTGELAWKVGDEQITHATPIAATIHGQRQVIFFLRSGLVAVNTETGMELWRQEYTFRTSTAASPVVYKDIVYVSAGYGVGAGAFRITKTDKGLEPELLWRKRNKLMNHWSTPVCRDGYLYGMFSFKKYGKGPLCCVDIETGETMWSESGFGPGNAIAVGDTLIALSDTGEVALVALKSDAYEELARDALLEGKCWSSPAFSDGRLYVRSTVEGVCVDLSGKG